MCLTRLAPSSPRRRGWGVRIDPSRVLIPEGDQPSCRQQPVRRTNSHFWTFKPNVRPVPFESAHYPRLALHHPAPRKSTSAPHLTTKMHACTIAGTGSTQTQRAPPSPKEGGALCGPDDATRVRRPGSGGRSGPLPAPRRSAPPSSRPAPPAAAAPSPHRSRPSAARRGETALCGCRSRADD